MTDYLIVGGGLSGIAVAEELMKAGKSLKIFENYSQNSSSVAGGMYNPVILKRFTLAWEADEQMKISLPFYEELEKKLGVRLLNPLPVYRKFSSVEEQNNWFEASDKKTLSAFLDPRLVSQLNPWIVSPFSFGRLIGTGTLNTALLLEKYHGYLKKEGMLETGSFEHDQLEELPGKEGFRYKDISCRGVVFCEGFGMKENPFFSYLPLRGNKGEYLLIEAPDLKLEVAVKSSVFILPQGDDIYKIGATYNPTDNDPAPTEAAREKLLKEVEKMISCSFKVIGQVAGIRPATPDRKPLLGRHPEHPGLYCCNGFGSRGVLIAPQAAKNLVRFMEKDERLPEEMDIRRFNKNP